MIAKLVSGGQAGVDLAALDAAQEFGIATGGWMPEKFLTEDGPRPECEAKYGLRQITLGGYLERTRRNVRDSDATIILVDSPEQATGGTALTARSAAELGRCYVIVFMGNPGAVSFVAGWLHGCGASAVNFAGPRESRAPGIYERTRAFLRQVFEVCKHGCMGKSS